MNDRGAIVKEKIAAIEAEMRRIGLWQEEPLPKRAYDYTLAFAQDSMAFHQWLQFVFIPQVKKMAEDYEELPKMSRVSPAAVRAFEGWDKGSRLIVLLKEFDNLFVQ
jgi:uncharacterized protein YqcC (DUF446 family)